jgi:hypothetical protein
MPRSTTRALVFIASIALALAAAGTARAEKAAVLPLENHAGLTADEIAVLTGAVRAALLKEGSGVEVVPIDSTPIVPCDAACASARAKELGARYLVSGAISLFGGQYTVRLEAFDRASGTLAASAGTPPTAALADELALARTAAAQLIADLAARTKPSVTAVAQASAPAPAVPAPRPSPAPPPGPRLPNPGPNASGLVVVTDPPGASVWLGHTLVFAGTTPVAKILPPGGTRVTVSLDGYKAVISMPVALFRGETKTLRLKLDKREPLVEAGATLIVFGSVTSVPGAIMLGIGRERGVSDITGAGAVMLSAGGAAIVTSTALLIANALKRKRAREKEGAGFYAVVPLDGGAAAAFGRAF